MLTCRRGFQFTIRDASSGEQMALHDFSDMDAKYGYTTATYHRADLHSELKLLATSPTEGKHSAATLRTGVRIVDVVRQTRLMARLRI